MVNALKYYIILTLFFMPITSFTQLAQVSIEDIKLSGSGCVQEDAITVDQDGDGKTDSIWFGYSSMAVEIGSEAPKDSSVIRFCDISLKVNFPEGWTLGILKDLIYGIESLEKDIKLELLLRYRWNEKSFVIVKEFEGGADNRTLQTKNEIFYDTFEWDPWRYLEPICEMCNPNSPVTINMRIEAKLTGDQKEYSGVFIMDHSLEFLDKKNWQPLPFPN